MSEEIEKRVCNFCKEEKPLSNFYNSKRGLHGKGSRCKICLLEISKKYKKYYTEDYTIENLPGEIWKIIPNTDNLYEASNKGRIKSLRRTVKTKDGRKYSKPQKIMAKGDNGNGYKTVMLSTPLREKSYRAYVHRLVMEAFEGGKELEVDHIDGDKNNNELSNLRYCTNRENKHFYHSKKESSSNCMGVSYLEALNKFSSTIKIDGISYNLGHFEIEYQACQEYKKALRVWREKGKLPYEKTFYGKRNPKTTGIIEAHKKFYYRKYYNYKVYKVNSFKIKEDAIKCKSIFDAFVPEELNEELLEFFIEEFNNKYYPCH